MVRVIEFFALLFYIGIFTSAAYYWYSVVFCGQPNPAQQKWYTQAEWEENRDNIRSIEAQMSDVRKMDLEYKYEPPKKHLDYRIKQEDV